jgi:hypothetical protein
MGLGAQLERIAGIASAYGEVTGVLAAEPAGRRRLYLVALGTETDRRWLVLDADGAVADRRNEVREAASIVAMCELAAELAGGGDLQALRARLEHVRLTEEADGIEDAESAALALEQVIGEAPRVAAPGYLDDVGAATMVLERALGELTSPFSEALRASTGAVGGFVDEVERAYLVDLR